MAKLLIGIVSSDKPDKSVIVTIHARTTHPLYKKQYSVSRSYMVHDEKNEAHVGDKVSFKETRPLSARKRHVLVEVIERPAIKEDQKIESIEQVEKRPVSKKKVELETKEKA